MEMQAKLFKESEDKNVDFSIAESEARGRYESYKKAFGNIRETSRPEILPFREDAMEISRIYEEKNEIKVYDRKGYDSRTKGFRENINETPTLTQKMGTGGNNVPMVQALRHLNRNGRLLHQDNYASSLQTSGNEEGVWIENRLRRLTPTECERLQSFPENWTRFGINEKGENIIISDSRRYKCLGNAVTVNVIDVIVKSIVSISK